MIRSLIYSLAPPSGTLNRDLKLIFASNFIGAIGDGLYAYILPLYIRGLQASSADVGFLFSIFLLSTALTIIPGGFLADRYDRKKVMIVGWLLWVPVPMIFSMATHWAQLIPVMGLYGFFLSGPATGAYIVTAARRDRVTLTYTLMSASWWTGYIFSPGLGGYLSTTIVGMRGVFLLAFTLYAVATAVLFLVHSQTAQRFPEEQQPNLKKHSTHAQKIVMLSVFFAFIFFFLNLVRPLVVQFFQDVYKLENPVIGLLGSVAFLGSAVFSLLLGKTGDKLGKMIAVATALVIGGLSFGLFICFSNPFILGAASFLNGASYMLWSLMGASVGSIAPAASRGRWISLAQMSATLAATVAPYLGGVLYAGTPVVPFYVMIAVTPILSIIALAWPFKERHSIVEASDQS